MIKKLYVDLTSKLENITLNNDEIICENERVKIKIFYFTTDDIMNLLSSYKQKNKSNGYESIMIYEDEIINRVW